ncbi:MAG TPA: S8 family serine peptidase [Thermoanaerobaculales bacterium]|nr:S8 family serine peptidase [Thermoanaerobaculales bacterium]HQL30315.1 S8 family serine peptidase [Thermoanaerobaculales bacterium]
MKRIVLGLLIALVGSPAFGGGPSRDLGGHLPHAVADAASNAFARLDTPVAAIAAAADPLVEARRSGFRVLDSKVQLELVAAPSGVAELASWLEAAGATAIDSSGPVLEAFVPAGLLVALDRHPAVQWVRRPPVAVLPEPWLEAAATAPKVAVISEGVAATNVAEWHGDGFTGDGVKVGVIDIEMYGWDDLLGTELPPGDMVHYQSFGGGSSSAGEVHGTAVAEIIHDMAPDAELYLAEIGGTTSNFFNAVQWMVSSGVRVIAMSITYFGISPGDGTGAFQNQIASFVASASGVWAHSAGNYRDSHWQGQSFDADGDGWVEMDGADEIQAFSSSSSAGDDIRVSLQWSDWSAVNQDYSLHLFRVDLAEPVEVAAADSRQTGIPGQAPAEFLDFTVSETGRYGVGVFRKSVTGTHAMELFSLDEPVSGSVEEGSVTTPGDAPAAMATGAMAVGSQAVRAFSSAGPVNGPGGTLEGGAVKPDVAAYDGVSTASYGGQSFGTSFACPHVAGAAAVVMSAQPAWTGAQVRAFLEQASIDKGTAGMDNDFGWGRLNLGPSPLSTCSYSLDQASLEFGVGSGSAIVNVDTAAGCFWSAESQSAWLRVPIDNDTGPGRVIVLAEANPGPSRTGSLLIAGTTVPVTQAGNDCTYSVEPLSFRLSVRGGAEELEVSAPAGCDWTAASQEDWIVVTGGASGSGSGTVTFAIGENSLTWPASPRTGTLLVAGQTVEVHQLAFGYRYMVGGIAETAGAAGTRWKSSLALANPRSEPVDATLTYRHQDGTDSAELTVPGEHIVEVDNVAVELFGRPDSSGVVDVQASDQLLVTARTYNDAPAGTFGQYLPGVMSDEAVSTGQRGVLSQLSSNAAFRTNIGFVNLGGYPAQARIRLFDGGGAARGSELVELVPAGRWLQVNRVFQAAGAGTCQGCYALIDAVSDGEAWIWAYASVVDNGSGDPTTIPLTILYDNVPDADVLVAGIADIDGAEGTRWASNLALLNLSGAAINGTAEYRYGGGTAQADFAVGDGELLEWENVAVALGAPDSSGAVAIVADGPAVVTARTFNNAPEGTFGQFLPGVGASSATGPPQGLNGSLYQIKSTGDFRTNVGFTNFSDAPCDVTVTLHGADGSQLGSPVSVTGIPAGRWKQVNRIFEAAGAGECPIGYAVVTPVTPGCLVWAYASVVDNGSGDPTTIPMVKAY